MQRFIFFVLFALCSACDSESIEPHMKLSANFDASKIVQVESVLESVAERFELKIFRKDREKMQYLSQGKTAFFTALYFNEDPILILTNVGVADTLVLTVTDYQKMPIDELERIAAEVIAGIESNVGVDFEEG